MKNNFSANNIALLFILLAGGLLSSANANRENWVKAEREQKCEKIVEATVAGIEKVSALGSDQEIVAATIKVLATVKDSDRNKSIAEVSTVYFLRPKVGVVIRDGSHPSIEKGNTYTLYLTRIREINDLRSVLFVEMAGDTKKLSVKK